MSQNVFNGDIGFIAEIDLFNQTVAVDFEGHPAKYEWSDTDELSLAYAVLVYKAPNSEFSVIVMPVVMLHY